MKRETMIGISFKAFPMILMLGVAILSLINLDTSCSRSMLSSSTKSSTISPFLLPQPSYFENAIQMAYRTVESTSQPPPKKTKQPFDVMTWDKKTTGGLQDSDRILLASIYGNAYSVFEYGLGESTYIADAMGVERYAGIDSDATWVALARDKVSPHFRFYFADIGTTIAWGHPQDAALSKNILHYQLLPLIVEPQPFDVYMADGRWRIPCMILSFLHASSRGADTSKTIVLLHDCFRKEHWNAEGEGTFPKRLDNRPNYRSADHLLDLVNHSGNRLCVYQRKPETTDEQLFKFWQKIYQMIG
jgi:hypothetical protein